MFAVGHKVRTADATTYASFHDRMAALMDTGSPGRVTLVQAGVDDVASHLFPTDPAAPPNALVVLPEETGLVAALTGSRGTAARAQTTATDAIVALFGPYNAPYGYYRARYPGQPPVRTLVLALTDTLYRGSYETFRELAMTHGICLAASFNAAPARRVDDATVAAQPEACSYAAYPDAPWQLDSCKSGGCARLEKYWPWVTNADATITGTPCDDVTFYGQSAVLGRRQKTSPAPLAPNSASIR